MNFMVEKINAFISKEELYRLKMSKINYAHFYLSEKSLVKWIGHFPENKVWEVMIQKINFQDENFCLKDLIEELFDNDEFPIVKTINFNEWLCLKNQEKVRVRFLEKINFQKDRVDLATIRIFKKIPEEIIKP